MSTVFWLLACSSCAAGPPVPQVPSAPLVRSGGETVDVRELAGSARLTVLVFFSARCRCLDQHEERLKALYDQYRARGVQLLMIDSEANASPERDEAEAQRRGYPFPILGDRGGRLADQLSARYATYSVVTDGEGRIRYRGGIDSDMNHLRDDATAYLRDALDDLLAGRSPRVAEGKTLGCSLERW